METVWNDLNEAKRWNVWNGLERAFRLPESVALSFSPINASRWSHPVQVFR
jgi:hypothetical protein